MAPTDGKRASRCGRGVLKLTSFLPCPRPGELKRTMQQKEVDIKRSTQNITNSNIPMNSTHSSTSLKQESATKSNQGMVKDIRFKTSQTNGATVIRSSDNNSSTGASKDLPKVLAKFSYTANPERPGGFDELTIKQGDKVYFCHPHKNNPHWVLVENFNGDSGYVPATYLMELKAQPTQLPWLENKHIEKEAEKQQQKSNQEPGGFGAPEPGTTPKTVKPYVSAYVDQPQTSEYNCDLCGKSFNGPLPYKMHMASKAHREEVEYQKLS